MPKPPPATRPRSRRRVALELGLDELHEALSIAGYRSVEGSRLLTAVHDLERDVVRVVIEGAGYPIVDVGCEPPRYRAADVRSGLRVIAERAAAAVDMLLVPKPPRPDQSPLLDGLPVPPPDLGDGGLGVGMAVST